MKIEGLELHAREKDGTGWAIPISWNKVADVLGISWHKEIQTTGQTERGTFYSLPTFENLSFVTIDSLPGCILNTVQLLACGESREPRGVQFCSASRLPISPNGKTLLGYIDLLRKFPGFECLGDLIKTLGRGEEFLDGIHIHTDIVMQSTVLAA